MNTSTRFLTALAGLTLILAGAPAPAAGPSPTTAAAMAEPGPPADPVRPGPAVQRFDLDPARPGFRAQAGAPVLTRRATAPFSLLGVTWTDPAEPLDEPVEVRTRSAVTGRWSPWQELHSDGRSPADPGGVDRGRRGSTDPVWVGASDGVEARLAGDGGRAPRPDGLRLNLINPDQPATAPDGRSAADVPPPGVAAPGVAAPGRPVPPMVTRAGWQANEKIVKNQPQYTDDVQVVFVHHTAGTNQYSCADSPRIVRGIELYHVHGNGWNDIGYNFLVDRCGTLFEGRKGGAGRAVLGAHTMGFNSHSSAIAVLGDYGVRSVSANVRAVIAQVAAYKLGAYGNLATGRTVLVSSGSDRYRKGTRVTFNRISGHRDAGRTACPGTTLYGQLGSIRRLAGAGPAGLAWERLNGAVRVGATYYTRGLLSPQWTTRTQSRLMDRFDILVDGVRVSSVRNVYRRGTIRLPAGRHTVTVRAVHLSGRSASITATVISDATPPVFTSGPTLWLRPGSLTGSVPVRLGWTASDPGGLRSVALTRPRPRNLGLAARTWPTVARPGAATTWTVRASDRAGNARNASVTRTPVVLSETAAARTGRWKAVRHPVYLGGAGYLGRTRGASLSWTFTGRAAALGVSRTAASGRVIIYVDGKRAGTLDLRSTSTVHRRAIWAKNWGSAERRTVKVVVEGSTGRPGVILDGLVVLR